MPCHYKLVRYQPDVYPIFPYSPIGDIYTQLSTMMTVENLGVNIGE